MCSGGQSTNVPETEENCIGTQRILIESSIYDEFKRQFVAAIEALTVGNPAGPETDVGL
jgi:acyl-CoA reductase-like NAD-dependent aldehyde dehydrogenase